jgi:hypothetical protein
MKRTSLLVLLSVLFYPGVALQADDVFPPAWRGQYGSITAVWDDWGPSGLGPRTLLQTESELQQANPGGFSDTFPAWAYFDSSVYVHDVLQGRTSVLEIPGSYWTVDHVGFRLSDYAGGDLKYLQVQITFFGPGPAWFRLGAFSSDPGQPPWPLDPAVPAAVQNSYMHPDGWQTNSYLFTFMPNPLYEGFSFIFPETQTGFVDQVVIDTLCIPEPSSLALIAALGLLVVRRRHR